MSFLDKMKQIASETESTRQSAEDERRQRRLNVIDDQFSHIVESLQSDIEKDVRGEGSWKGHVVGFIHYWLEDDNHTHLKVVKQWDRISSADIEVLAGFAKLKAHCDALGVTMKLEEVDDERETLRLYNISPYTSKTTVVNFIVKIAGWK